MARDYYGPDFERFKIACRIDSTAAVSKAQEILRLMEVKCGPSSLGKGELCRTVIAFDLACRSLGCPIAHGAAVKLSKVPEGIYATSIRTAHRLLGFQRKYTPEEIAKEMEDGSVGAMASRELKRYQERFLDSYPSRQVMSLDLDGSIFAVAAFYLCAKKLNHPVDKRRLLDFALVGDEEFANVCRSMLDLCYSTLATSARHKPCQDGPRYHHLTAASRSGPSSASGDMMKSKTSPDVGHANKLLQRSGDDSASRRPIPLTREMGGEMLNRHVASLARSIRLAATRKRHGSATVTPIEPGDHRPSTNKDTAYNLSPKRSRTSARALASGEASRGQTGPSPSPAVASNGPDPHGSIEGPCRSTTLPSVMLGTPVLEQDHVAVSSMHSSGGDTSDGRHGAGEVDDCRGEPRGGHPPAANKPCSERQGRTWRDESRRNAEVRVASEGYEESKWTAVASTERKGKQYSSGGDEEVSSSGATRAGVGEGSEASTSRNPASMKQSSIRAFFARTTI